MIAIGAPVPEFELKDQNGKPISSSTLRGKNVLLSFHPLHGQVCVNVRWKPWR